MAMAGLLSLLCPLLVAAFLVLCHASGSHCLHGRAPPPGRFFACIDPPFDASWHPAKKSLVYSYGRSFNGFAAKLSDEEVEKLSDIEGVVFSHSIVSDMDQFME